MKDYQVIKGYIVHKTKKGTFIFDGEQSVLHDLNSSASFIFEQMKKGVPLSKITTEVVKRYAVEPAQAQRDILRFVELLKKKNIVK